MVDDDAAAAADPSAAVAYGETKYWNSRYKQEGMQTFDWYQRYSGLANLLDKYISKKGKILVAGCGNSGMSAEMYEDGYKMIHNIDISPVVVEAMKEKYNDFPAMEWEVMDVKAMTFEDESFDTVVDKGMLDSLMCGDDSTVNARKMLSGVSRILRPNGTYVLITYGDPRLRMSHLQRPDYKWTVSFHVIPRPEVTRFSEERVKELVNEPVTVDDAGSMGEDLHWDDPDVHYVYICKRDGNTPRAAPNADVKDFAGK